MKVKKVNSSHYLNNYFDVTKRTDSESTELEGHISLHEAYVTLKP